MANGDAELMRRHYARGGGGTVYRALSLYSELHAMIGFRTMFKHQSSKRVVWGVGRVVVGGQDLVSYTIDHGSLPLSPGRKQGCGSHPHLAPSTQTPLL